MALQSQIMTEPRESAIFNVCFAAVAAGSFLVAAWGLCGCESAVNRITGPREVALADFAGAELTDVDSNAPGEATESTPQTAQDEAAAETPTAPVRLEAASSPPDEQRPRPMSDAAPRRVVVDSLVGQVNGRPIFANDFFAPISDQLAAIGSRSTQREFLQQSRPIIMEHLRQIVLNELFLAEAQSQLTTEQQQGIFAWMRYMRDTTIAEGGGTRTGTGQQLRDREGMTIEEYVAARRDMALLQQLRRNKIEPRVIVSWRDVEREYERRWDEFNPPATLHLARIRLLTETQADLIEQVNERLAAGESFAEIAASHDQSADGQRWQQFQMGSGGIESIALADHIKQHILNLEVGQTSEPFQQGSSTWWLHIAEIEQPEGRSLYDVQRQLHTALRNRRFNEEMNRYIESLFEEGIYDELDSMLLRLLEISVVRYSR